MGQQSYVAALNRCEQPECSAFFQQLDAEAGTCVWRTSFRAVTALFVGGLAVAELALQHAHTAIPLSFMRGEGEREAQ